MQVRAEACSRNSGHLGAAGRQARSCGAPLRGRRALTAARRRELGPPCRRRLLCAATNVTSRFVKLWEIPDQFDRAPELSDIDPVDEPSGGKWTCVIRDGVCTSPNDRRN